MFKSKDLLYHSIAILTVIIWGTTFVSTKILINTGLSPVEILLYRFVLAYFCILTIAHRRLWANCVKDEFLLFLSGLCGGSLYFIAENTALGITLASNVSLLICTAPIITTVLSHLFYKESLRKGLLYGSLVALFGVGLVVFNGSVLLKVNPLGDFLTLVAATMWAFYCLILKRLSRLYHPCLYTKSIFLWDTFSFLLLCDLPFKYQTRVIETASRIFKYIISGCHRLNALLYHVEYGSQSPRSIKNSQLYLHCPSGHLDNFCDFSIRNYYDSFWYWRFSHY